MTREEAKEQLIWYFDNDDGLGADLRTRQAYIKVIEVLGPCEDCVSRQEVIGLFDQNADAVRPYSQTWEEVKTLPSVIPMPLTCEDAISRQAVFETLNSINGTSELDKAFEVIENLPPVTPIHTETVTEFADRCRECGTRYGRYKDFCEYVAKMVLKDDFEENAGANAEFLCRKLSELGIVKADEDEWVLAEMESEE